MFETTYALTRSLTRDVTLRFLFRSYGAALIAALLAFAFVLHVTTRPEDSWLPGVLAGFLFASLRSLISAYRSGVRSADAFGSDPITLRLSDDGLEVTTSLSCVTSRWSAYPVVLSTRRYLYLTRVGLAQPFAIPASALSPEATAFLLDRVRHAGGRVRGA